MRDAGHIGSDLERVVQGAADAHDAEGMRPHQGAVSGGATARAQPVAQRDGGGVGEEVFIKRYLGLEVSSRKEGSRPSSLAVLGKLHPSDGLAQTEREPIEAAEALAAPGLQARGEVIGEYLALVVEVGEENEEGVVGIVRPGFLRKMGTCCYYLGGRHKS